MDTERGAAPLYGLISTKDSRGERVILKTLGNSQGYQYMTVKLGTNHGGLEITAHESGDFELAFVPWKSPVGTTRGTKRLLSKGNLRDIEDLFPPKPQLQNMPLWEHEAHQEYADNQKVYE